MQEPKDTYFILLDQLFELTNYCFSICHFEEDKYENIETHKMFQAAKILVSSYTKLTKIFEIEDPRTFKVAKTQYDWFKTIEGMNQLAKQLSVTDASYNKTNNNVFRSAKKEK